MSNNELIDNYTKSILKKLGLSKSLYSVVYNILDDFYNKILVYESYKEDPYNKQSPYGTGEEYD